MSLLVEGAALRVERHGRRLLDDLDLTLEPGVMLGVLGPNGAGKSTLLKVLAGLLPHDGALRLAGRSLLAHSPAERARLLGYLPQFPALGWPLTVREVVTLGRRPHAGTPQALEDERVVDRCLTQFGLATHAGRLCDGLSGGELMRVHLARVAAGQPRLWLVDEPTSALDPAAQLEILERLRGHARDGSAVMLVMHDLPLAARYCDRLLVLEAGRTVARGTPGEVLSDQLLQRVFGVCGLWQRTSDRDMLLGITLPGHPP